MSLLDSLLSDSTETTSLNINMNSTPNSSSPKGSQQSTSDDLNVSTQDSGAPKDSVKRLHQKIRIIAHNPLKAVSFHKNQE